MRIFPKTGHKRLAEIACRSDAESSVRELECGVEQGQSKPRISEVD